MTASLISGIWHYEYLPFFMREPDDMTIEREIPNYRIFSVEGVDGDEDHIAETNEQLPGEVQERHARLISAAPELLDAVEYFFNIMHDYQGSVRKGYVKLALKKARAVIAKAKGGAS
jgi:hypothetical protein